MKELDGKSCLFEKSNYVCGILKVKDCKKCKFRVPNTKENYEERIIQVKKDIDMYKAKHLI